MIRIAFVSLGCDKNLVDTEHMIAILPKNDYEIVQEESQADVIVVNTCCFINDALEESIDTILELAELKKEGSCRALIAAGCMAERYRDEVLSEIPEIDAVIGTGSFARIDETVRAVLNGGTVRHFDAPGELELPPLRTDSVMMTAGSYAYLKIAEGCDKHCTYCIIPKLRGPYRSVPADQLLREARQLAGQGVRELILIAEETTRYGTDLCGEKTLHLLVRQLSEISGIRWIRLLYCYPEEIYPELIEEIRTNPKVCHYLDLPIQHADNEILRQMGRRTTRESILDLISVLRREIPDIVLRTTLISGFPGETEDQHLAMAEFMKAVRFDRLGVFAYSQEEGTAAAEMEGQIPEEIRKERRDRLLALQQGISLENCRERIGSVLEVQIEGYLSSEDVYVGRSYADAPGVDGMCFVSSGLPLNTGDFVRVRITDAREYDLTGVLEGDETDESAE